MNYTDIDEKLIQQNAVPNAHSNGTPLPPWVFQHEGLTNVIESAREIETKDLINTLNYLHFQNRPLYILLRHHKYNGDILVKAHPDVCTKSEFTCHWESNTIPNLNVEQYEFRHAFIEEGQSIILVPAIMQRMDNESLCLQLPEVSYAVGRRRFTRFACQGITAELIQNGLIAKGELLDFSPVAFRISIHRNLSNSIPWFNPDVATTINLTHHEIIIFSGECRCIRQAKASSHAEFVFAPFTNTISRFKAREIRSPRLRITPAPSIVFEHPFCRKTIQRKIFDISTSGCSILEKAGERALMPGMIIHNLTIMYAGGLEITCTAQVLYSKEEQQQIRSGLAILDMELTAYSHLVHILGQNIDPSLCIASKVDMDALWELFFETGFIYPEKYKLLDPYRNDFTKTYQKLYRQNSEISFHFTYQKSSRIYSHVSMIRAYEKAWLIHHLAARGNKLTGLKVLKRVMYCIYDMCRLPSANMDYIMCCFRPQTELMNSVCSDFAKSLSDPKRCSLDLFSYLSFHAQFPAPEFPEHWALKVCSDADIWELEQFYNNASGGLLMDVLQLRNKTSTDASVGKAYQLLDLKRKWIAYALSYKKVLKAVLIADQSDIGVNLSELLNGIKIMILDDEGLPWSVLSSAIAQLAHTHYSENVTILVYPDAYLNTQNMPSERKYSLWIMDIQCIDEFSKYLVPHFRFILRQ